MGQAAPGADAANMRLDATVSADAGQPVSLSIFASTSAGATTSMDGAV